MGCDDVLISEIRILNDLNVANSDGIDPDHSTNVRIIGCHITCDSENGVFLSGSDGNHIEDVLLEKVSVTVRGDKSKWPKGMYDLRPGYGQKIEEIKAAGFYMRRADDVVLRNCRVRFAGADMSQFAEALYAEDCGNLVLEVGTCAVIRNDLRGNDHE